MKRWITPARKDQTDDGAAAVQSYGVFRRDLPGSLHAGVASGAEICTGLRLFHDASEAELLWLQTADTAMQLTIYHFSGTYLSLAAGTEPAFRTAVGRGQRIVAHMDIQATRPITTFVRLNLQMEDGRETLYETLVIDTGVRSARYDMDAVMRSFDGLQGVWLDVIFSAPEMIELRIHDLQLSAVND